MLCEVLPAGKCCTKINWDCFHRKVPSACFFQDFNFSINLYHYHTICSEVDLYLAVQFNLFIFLLYIVEFYDVCTRPFSRKQFHVLNHMTKTVEVLEVR